MVSAFTPSHRGGSGPPPVCLHGFTDTWRTWELVPALERGHDVLAPTLPGHAGGPPLAGAVSEALLADAEAGLCASTRARGVRAQVLLPPVSPTEPAVAASVRV